MTILTTHVGSLPRTQDVVDFIFARERGTPFDPAVFDDAMTRAVSETVKRQVGARVGIVSDGETSKISYATYVKDRYTGFDGDSPRNAPADLRLFPGFLKRLAGAGGDCGFGTFAGFGAVDPDICYAKLATLADGAERMR